MLSGVLRLTTLSCSSFRVTCLCWVGVVSGATGQIPDSVPIPTKTGPGDGACCAVVVLVRVSVVFHCQCHCDCATTRFDLKVRSANICRTQSHGHSNKSHRRPCLQSSSSSSSRTTSNCEERSLSSAADSSMRNACTSSPQSGSSPPVISKPTVPKSSIEVKRMARKSANARSEVA